ncbi:MAG: 30S ribosomal protein S1 [Anaerolineae bacterium]|nr:MAG: 30S ribosomal protein S1 [Anaerolineae bacterium]
MTSKKVELDSSLPPDPPDESWWAAVLAEEEDHSGEDEHPAERFTDWELARRLLMEDRIIELPVTGYNRGGVLVEGERILGFVPISHLTELDNTACSEKLKSYLGRQLKLKVIECRPEGERVVLSERAAQAGQGKRLELLRSLRPGLHLRGRVTTITDFGVFIDLGGVEGLAHISELSWGRVSHPSEVVQCGQEVEVCVLHVNRRRNRIALSLKRLRPNPWETVLERYQIGQIVPARITCLVSYGAFARLEEGLDGLIHISQMPGSPRRPEEVITAGDKVKVEILHINPQKQQLGLRLHRTESG